MITEAFSPKFHTLTPAAKMNFIGAVFRYFPSFTSGFEDETINTYIRDYNERIFPLISPGIPISEYNENYIEELLHLIKVQNSYNDATIESRYRHLLIDPYTAYYKDHASIDNADDPLWGSAYRFNNNSFSDNLDSAFLKMPKSLDWPQERKAAKILLNHTTDNGANIGLALMLCCGVRNNEAVGFNFGDLSEMQDHPGIYTLLLARTSVRDNNQRKAGGKTKNAPRRIPLIKRFSDFLLSRMEYLKSKIAFPFVDKDGRRFESIGDLPIACRRTDYSIPCSAGDLSRAGRVFFRDELKMREQDISAISVFLQHIEYDLVEKDPTTYLLRRNLATHLYTLGFPPEWREYYMGHLIEDDTFRRSDFNDEVFLSEMAALLENHPLNERYFEPPRISISSPDSRQKYIIIENAELNDPVSITFNNFYGNAEIVSLESFRTLPQQINITKFWASNFGK